MMRIKAAFMRGGTSKAVMFRRQDLPADPAAWDEIFLSLMGSPDTAGRQLDGMGGGLSSLSKVCVIGPPSRGDADVDFTFAQIGVQDAIVDYSANCGNMSSAVGPFALEEGLLPAPAGAEAVVRIHNTNTGKIIRARFPVRDGRLDPAGEMRLDGVAGQAAAIRLEFLDPGGAKTGRLLPTGRAADTVEIPGLGPLTASCVDAGNPCVFVAAGDLERHGNELPAALDDDRYLLERLEFIRRWASVRMGLAADMAAAAALKSVPKVAMLAPPGASETLSGDHLRAEDADIIVRMISVGQPHRAVPVTGAICLAVACRIPGTVAHGLWRPVEGAIRIAHASGVSLVDSELHRDPAAPAGVVAAHGAIYRTARRLFEGHVFCPPAATAG